jgi:hypothetical protein
VNADLSSVKVLCRHTIGKVDVDLGSVAEGGAKFLVSLMKLGVDAECHGE